MSEIFERLPTFAKPEHYSIYLEPDIREFTANGRVDILIDVRFLSKIWLILAILVRRAKRLCQVTLRVLRT
jgi:hypothetical protein